MPQSPTSRSSSAKKPDAKSAQRRSRRSYNRSPYRQKTVVMRVPGSLVPQVRKMLAQCRSETARRIKRKITASAKLKPSVKSKTKTPIKGQIKTKTKPRVRR